MKTIDALKTTLRKFPADYARGRADHAALSAYASPGDVLGALAFGSPLAYPERDAITFALIAEHQRTSRPLWSSVLLVAYEPMLANVRRRLHDKRDAEARIVLAFLEAIAKVSLAHPPSHLALDLRRAVERSVFGTGAASREEPETVSLEGARKERSPENPEAHVEVEEQKRILALELADVFGDEARDVLDVLLRARAGREQLLALVEELHPDLTSKQRAAIYERLQRLRRRALIHFAERWGHEAERASTSAA